MLSRHKPHLPIIALTPHEIVAHQLSFSFGIIPIFDRSRVAQFEEAVVLAKRILIEQKCAKKGDTFVLVAGLPFGTTGSTNTCSIQVV